MRNHTGNRLFFTGLLACGLLVGAGVFSHAHAQADPAAAPQGKSTFSTVLTLNDRQTDYDVVSFTYLTRDDASSLGTREIFQKHRNNLRGERLSGGPINMSFEPVPHWMIVDISNNSRKSDWVLDFGSMAAGRTGILPRIMISEGQRDTLLVDGLPRAGAHMLGYGLNRHTLPLTILPGQQVSLVMYMVPSDHIPTIITPRLIEASTYLRETAVPGLDFQRLVFMLLAGCAVYFAGNMLLRRGIGFFPHMLFFGVQAGWFWLASERIFTALPASMHLPGVAIIAGGLLALAATQAIIASQDSEGGDSILMYICASFVLMAMMAFVFGLPTGSMLRPAFVYGIGGLAYLIAAIKAFTAKKELRLAGAMLGFAWVLMLVGLAVPPLTALGYLPMDALFLQASWTVMPLVCAFMVISGSLQIRANNLDIIRDVLRQAQRAQVLNRMKQTQETADHARLMRVIEREREIMEDLRNRDAERTEEMRMAKIGADEANRAKSAFLAVVSHEIRTPMTGIMGMLRLLQDTQLSPQQREYAHTIKDSGDAMLALLNDILDFSKIESGGMDIEIIDFDLHRVVNSVIMLMNGHAAAKGITLKSEMPAGTPRYLKGDPTRLRQILLNLVGNAIKFTTQGGVTVHVRPGNMTGDASAAADDNQHATTPVYFAVEDTGIGISPSAQENLFNPFAQADSSIARKFGGTGLGLAICKRLIEAMGSTIKLDSRENQGTTFYFTLHMQTGDAGAVEDAEGNAAPAVLARALHVLVVDDNPINRKVIEGLLVRDAHIVTCAESGAEALELLHNQSFDLVLMDIEMPGMDGVVTLQNLRASDAPCKDVPIVALTGNIAQEDTARYREAGMHEVLGKPIDPERMRAVLLAIGGPRPAGQTTGEGSAASGFDFSDDELDADSFSESVEFESAPVPAQTVPDMPADDAYVPMPPEPAVAPAPATDVPPAQTAALLDDTMLQTLRASLGAEQLSEMIASVVAHNTQTLPGLQAALNEGDMKVLGALAHELKGMNANFGLAAVSQVCGRIEHGARHNSIGADTMDELVFNELPEAMAQSERVLMGQA